QVDRRHAGGLALGALRAHCGDLGERGATPHPHDGELTSRSSRSASSSRSCPLVGWDIPATLTRTFSTAPSTAARARISATFASDRAFLFPMAPISRAS